MFTEVTDMLLFAAVVRAGSLTQAGQALDLPKSTVSRRLAALEDRIGSQLLHKTTRRLVLTEAGEAFLEHCKHLTEAAEQALSYTSDLGNSPSGTLRVTMPPNLNDPRLHCAIATYLERCPDVDLELDESPQFVDLVQERVDLAIRAGALPDSSLVARRLTDMRLGLYASPRYLAKHPAPQRPEDLSHHTFVVVQGRHRLDRITLRSADQEVELFLPGRITVNTSDMQLRLGQAGAAAISYPEAQAAASVASGQLQRLLPEWSAGEARLWLVTPSRRLLASKTQVFIDCLFEKYEGNQDEPHRDPA